MRGWYDFERGIACVSGGRFGFAGTYEQFIERCERMDAKSITGPGADTRVRGAKPDHPEARDWPGDCHYWADLSVPGWDANGSPTEEL